MINSVTKAENFLIPLIDVKAHLRIDANFDDSYLYQIIQAAQENVRRFTGRAIAIETFEFIPSNSRNLRTFEAALDECASDRLTFRVGFITQLVSVKTYDLVGVETAYDVTLFDVMNNDQFSEVVRKNGTDVPRGTRTYKDLVVTFKAGYTEATLPFGLRQALLMLIGFYYENRDTMVDVNLSDPGTIGIRQMLQKYKLEFM